MSFSTLYGSKWVATLVAASDPESRNKFQYPLRVEVGCNRRHTRLQALFSDVSVPSTGRSGLQLKSLKQKVVRIASFSTLYGSKWVATKSSGRKTCGRLLFQYPLRVEVGCNLFLPGALARLLHVSVPSTGRSGLQPDRCDAHRLRL